MAHEFHTKSLRRAAQSLEGLSCGDAFGERFFLPDSLTKSLIQQRALPAPPWFFTDDTVMALSILETLAQHSEINQDYLARSFAGRYDPGRGYGPAMHKLLARSVGTIKPGALNPPRFLAAKVPMEMAQLWGSFHWARILQTTLRRSSNKPAFLRSQLTPTWKPWQAQSQWRSTGNRREHGCLNSRPTHE
jgi:hypothetical protein